MSIPLTTLDIAVLGVYAVLLIGVGLVMGKKVKNAGDFFSGGKKVPWWMGAISSYMAMISCFVFIAYAQIGYEDGLVGLTVFWSTAFAILVGTFVFARRWQRANLATPVEYLERRYGSGVRQMLSWSGGSGGTQSYAATFGEVLIWTLIWAFFATFTNYFLGMFVAMAINKKGIKFKKGWRTILVLTIAIPQFISLLYVSKMFAKNGIINGFLLDMGWITQAIDFFGDASRPWLARVTVILINIWIGIPYLMLITTGILMNIPADLYESAKIDGASGWQQYRKITLPYMLFVTGPYLLTSFTGNMNNFNVIYLLTAGAPTNAAASSASGSVGYTDLLITWLFKITMGAESKYYLASVIGILVFVVVALISLIVYNLLPSIKNEEDFR